MPLAFVGPLATDCRIGGLCKTTNVPPGKILQVKAFRKRIRRTMLYYFHQGFVDRDTGRQGATIAKRGVGPRGLVKASTEPSSALPVFQVFHT